MSEIDDLRSELLEAQEHNDSYRADNQRLRAIINQLSYALAEALDGWEQGAYYPSERTRIAEMRKLIE